MFRLCQIVGDPVGVCLTAMVDPFPSFVDLTRVFLVLGTVTGGTGSVMALSSPAYQGLLCTVLCFVYPGATSNSVRLLPLYLVPSSRDGLSHTYHLC